MAAAGRNPPEIQISRSSTKSPPGSVKLPPKRERRTSPGVATVGRVITAFQTKHGHSSSWRVNNQNPDLKWYKNWTQRCFDNGRVLLIDYVSNERTRESDLENASKHRHLAVAAQEFEGVDELERFYDNPRHANQAALRIIHVQNAAWATRFLMKKFCIDHESDLIGMEGFNRWARFERPRLRNGKPFPSGRSWRVQMDPWRNITRTAIGVDYMKTSETIPPTERSSWTAPSGTQVLHLNTYDDSHSPYGHDVSIQRFSVYVQRNLGPVNEVSPEEEFKVPYTRHAANGDVHEDQTRSKWKTNKIDPESLDNSNTIIIFENSASTKLEDCLIQPRNEIEKRWRRLSFYLKKDDAQDDARVAAQCSHMILDDIFHGLAISWEGLLSKASEHVAQLEDKIYDNPADESRAPDLWVNQAAWLKVDKVMYLHRDILAELQGHLKEMTDDEDRESDWLIASANEYDKLAHTIQEDLIQPTNNLSDLMYKSVGIRDSRQSLQIGLSMWRLSWITFIFLPLTFIVGFFSMSVDIFADPVSVGWYFLAAVLLLLIVICLWYGIKSSLQLRRQTAYQRGVYERLYNELEDDYPQLWTSTGAAANVQPQGFWQKQKWRLLKHWFNPRRTVNKELRDWVDDDAGLGRWSRLKRHLLRTWLDQMRTQPLDIENTVHEIRPLSVASSLGHGEHGAVVELAKIATPVLFADADPEAAIQRIDPVTLRPVSAMSARSRRNNSGSPRASDDRPSSRGSHALMIEERNLSDSESEIFGPTVFGAESEDKR